MGRRGTECLMLFRDILEVVREIKCRVFGRHVWTSLGYSDLYDSEQRVCLVCFKLEGNWTKLSNRKECGGELHED